MSISRSFFFQTANWYFRITIQISWLQLLVLISDFSITSILPCASTGEYHFCAGVPRVVWHCVTKFLLHIAMIRNGSLQVLRETSWLRNRQAVLYMTYFWACPHKWVLNTGEGDGEKRDGAGRGEENLWTQVYWVTGISHILSCIMYCYV